MDRRKLRSRNLSALAHIDLNSIQMFPPIKISENFHLVKWKRYFQWKSYKSHIVELILNFIIDNWESDKPLYSMTVSCHMIFHISPITHLQFYWFNSQFGNWITSLSSLNCFSRALIWSSFNLIVDELFNLLFSAQKKAKRNRRRAKSLNLI